MTSREYYYKHFNELSHSKQFHFATRMKNFFRIHDFDDFFRKNKPSTDLKPIFLNNDYSRVNNYVERRPYFEKYCGLYGIEAALFRVHHLLKEYNYDTREKFINLYGIEKLYSLSDDLLMDGQALKILSTWAVNTIGLTEELFPRGNNPTKQLGEWILSEDTDEPTLAVYLCTHIILCESEFYTKDLCKSQNIEIIKKLLEKCAEIITENINTISLDAALEFLVCCKMIGIKYSELEFKINKICQDFKKNSPYLINYRRDKTPGSYFHTLDGAEHINTLYIMSGLDC